jgi:hypothetical protein
MLLRDCYIHAVLLVWFILEIFVVFLSFREVAMRVYSVGPMIRLFFLALPLTGRGFGLATPNIRPPFQSEPEERVHENQVVNQIKCELHEGFDEAINTFNGQGEYAGKSVAWLNSWGVKVTLKLSIDEKSSLNPGVTFFRTFENAVSVFPKNGNVTSGQNFALALGANVSSDATRTEIIDLTYGVSQLRAEALPSNMGQGLLI